MVKKVAFSPSQPRRAKTRRFHGQGRRMQGADRVPEGATVVVSGAYTAVREHDNGPRTPLADFFNIPTQTR